MCVSPPACTNAYWALVLHQQIDTLKGCAAGELIQNTSEATRADSHTHPHTRIHTQAVELSGLSVAACLINARAAPAVAGEYSAHSGSSAGYSTCWSGH